MNREQAAKLAQAYQWLAEGREVQHGVDGVWSFWDGHISSAPCDFRLKPEPEPLLECWAVTSSSGNCGFYLTLERARAVADHHSGRRVIHLRVVRAPDIEGMVKRFLAWKLPDDFAPDTGISFTPSPIQEPGNLHWPTGTCLLNGPQAEAMIRYILGEEK